MYRCCQAMNLHWVDCDACVGRNEVCELTRCESCQEYVSESRLTGAQVAIVLGTRRTPTVATALPRPSTFVATSASYAVLVNSRLGSEPVDDVVDGRGTRWVFDLGCSSLSAGDVVAEVTLWMTRTRGRTKSALKRDLERYVRELNQLRRAVPQEVAQCTCWCTCDRAAGVLTMSERQRCHGCENDDHGGCRCGENEAPIAQHDEDCPVWANSPQGQRNMARIRWVDERCTCHVSVHARLYEHATECYITQVAAVYAVGESLCCGAELRADFVARTPCDVCVDPWFGVMPTQFPRLYSTPRPPEVQPTAEPMKLDPEFRVECPSCLQMTDMHDAEWLGDDQHMYWQDSCRSCLNTVTATSDDVTRWQKNAHVVRIA